VLVLIAELVAGFLGDFCGEAFLKDTTEDLAGVIVRKASGLEDPDAARGFVGCEILPAPLNQVRFRG